MTVYVDDARIPASVPNGSRVHTSTWCHLTADTPEELHEFAGRLGLRRSYFQPGKAIAGKSSPFWHYDLTEGKVRQALALGAQQVSARDMPALMRARHAAAASILTADAADRAAGQAWREGDAEKALRFLAAARALDPTRAELWDARERRVRDTTVRGEHKPQVDPGGETSAADPGKCPGCRTANLTFGRETCQACAVVATVHGREAGLDREPGS
jgi:hypothetical protein